MSSDLNGNSNDNGKDVQPTTSNGKKNKFITLKVAEAEQRDVGRKIARVDPTVAERLNISTGDALEISLLGKKTTVLNWPARETDKDKGLIRIDGYTRNKLDVGINDSVELKKVESKDARSITLVLRNPLE